MNLTELEDDNYPYSTPFRFKQPRNRNILIIPESNKKRNPLTSIFPQ